MIADAFCAAVTLIIFGMAWYTGEDQLTWRAERDAVAQFCHAKLPVSFRGFERVDDPRTGKSHWRCNIASADDIRRTEY